jgi:poly(beta-D-mannuronate) lyase
MQYIIKLDKINSLPSVKGGDIINIEDGIYNNVDISLNYNGNEKKQITIQALNYGKVFIQGKVSISINGSYISFGNMIITGTGIIKIGGHHNRLTNCDISLNSPSIFIDSENSRVDHCILHDFSKSGQWFEVSRPSEKQNFILIDHNVFRNRQKGVGNGFETIRLGTSTKSLSNSNSIIAYNTFENCDGEYEIVTIKASNNIVFRNNFKNSFGSLSLRHGNNNLVAQNKFLQGNEASAGGLRVAAGENHILYNNLVKDA